MDYKSIVDKLADKTAEFEKLKQNGIELKSKLEQASAETDVEDLDIKLTENATQIDSLAKEIDELKDLKINALEEKRKGESEMTQSYLETDKALKDFAHLVQNAKDGADLKEKWSEKLAENAVEITGDTTLLPKQVILGIDSKIKKSIIFNYFRLMPAGQLVRQTFATDDTAITRGSGYNITEQKTEQASTLDIVSLPQNEIYKMTSLSYKVLKNMGDGVVNFVVDELTQFVINKIVDLALYDGEGQTTTNKNEGFDAVVKDTRAIHVQYEAALGLVNAIRLNSYRAAGDGEVEVATAGGRIASEESADTLLIVNDADYAKILDAVNALSYPVTDIAGWLGVSRIVRKNTTSANYKPIILPVGAYAVAMDDFDNFNWYNILSNRSQQEVVTLANGTLFSVSSAVVFEETVEQ